MNIGADVKHDEIFTKAEEQQLWESHSLELHSPQALLNAVFYLNGKKLCLCGGEEHQALKLSQVEHCSNPPSYRYVENSHLYYAKLPKDVMEKDVLYLRPLARMPKKKDLPWFSSMHASGKK